MDANLMRETVKYVAGPSQSMGLYVPHEPEFLPVLLALLCYCPVLALEELVLVNTYFCLSRDVLKKKKKDRLLQNLMVV